MNQEVGELNSPVIRPSVKKSKSLVSPMLDLLCGGGFSILLMGLFLVLVRSRLSVTEFTVEKAVTADVLVNWPHFMASYQLLYSSTNMVRRYQWAAVYFPVLLAVYCLYALADSLFLGKESPHYTILYGIAAFYLAIHYTGQSWGTMCTFCYIDGLSFQKYEKWLLRNGLRVLALWHMSWLTHQHFLIPRQYQNLSFLVYSAITVASMLSLLIGLLIFLNCWRRTRRLPSIRVVLPWLAIYLWYILIQFNPGAFFWLQISHSIQYLIFPARVEMNRFTEKHTDETHHVSSGLLTRHMLFYYFTLAFLGYAAFSGITLFSQSPKSALVAGVVVVYINIHHFFTDGCIWKISNRTVRDNLFAHLNTQKQDG